MTRSHRSTPAHRTRQAIRSCGQRAHCSRPPPPHDRTHGELETDMPSCELERASMRIIKWWRAGSGEVMRMAAGPGSGPFDAGTPAGLADWCEAWLLVTSLQVGCSLGRGAADALSDIDAALGVNTACGPAGAGQVEAVEAMVVAALPELGALVDVLR